jgi:DNA-binding SARP family transcriptional activator
MGKLTQAEVLIRDMQVLCNQPESHIVAQAYFRASTGLFYYVSGQTEMAEKTLRQLLSLPLFEELPPPVYFLTYGHLLLTVARDADQTAFESVATKLRQKVVPEMNYFHGSYMHYNLSTAYLMAGQPHRALLHAKEAVDRASRSDSMVAQMMPPLAYGQALVDNNNYQEAIEVFNKWCRIWKKKHFNLFACSGFLELAYCYIQKGMLDEARKAFDSAVSSLPEGQDLLHLNRTRDFTQRIKASVYPSETSIEPSFEMENKPVCITTFGDLLIRLADTFIYDRKWRGGRTKTLLKALIVFGGSKVSYELLMDTLWPEMDGDIAENNLKVTLSRLRKVGVKRGQRPIKWILVKNRKVSLAKPLCAVDSIIFHDSLKSFFKSQQTDINLLQAVLGLYKDDFLAKDQSEVWIIRHRERLREDYIQGVLLLAELCKQEGATGEAISYLHNACQKDPLNEQIYEVLMECYLETGYPSRAVQTYKLAEETLMRELGISPGPKLRQLAQKAGLRL